MSEVSDSAVSDSAVEALLNEITTSPVAGKGKAQPLVKKLTPAQKAAATKAKKHALEQANAQRLAQIVNLHISGMGLAEIGASIGATADEVDRLMQGDAARYIRSQPALRIYVRNYISDRYSKLLEAIWDDATDMNPTTKVSVSGFDKKLASQDRAIKILSQMAKLHGAEAPIQTEVKVEAAPEAVEKLVQALSAQQGFGYDTNIFDGDIVDAEIVHDAVEQSEQALEKSGTDEAVSGNEEPL